MESVMFYRYLKIHILRRSKNTRVMGGWRGHFCKQQRNSASDEEIGREYYVRCIVTNDGILQGMYTEIV